jgi:hypothetical protein
MCNIVARYGDRLYAVDFTRPAGVAWDTLTPIEAPVAFRASDASGTWRTVTLDSPRRTYQTPTLLLGPDGRANVFTLKPGDGTLTWFRAKTPANAAFGRQEIAMGWGAYLGGAIDPKGRALLVYWGNGQSDHGTTGYEAMTSGYRRSTIGYTLVDTVKGTHQNGVIDSPGAPYCYSQVAFDTNGAHVLTVRSEVKQTLLCGSRNHYVDLRYYYSSDPASGAKWQEVPIYSDPRSCIQPLGIEVDRKGYVHLLYYFVQERDDKTVVPHRLFYAVSRQPVSAKTAPQFVQRELKNSGWDGRLFQTRNGKIGVLAYRVGTQAEWAETTPGSGGKFTAWQPVDLKLSQCRIFPISRRGGSTLTDAVEGLFIGTTGTPAESSLYHFRLGDLTPQT